MKPPKLFYPNGMPPRPHADDVAVRCFAEAMRDKLAAKRAEGYGGWDDKETCSNEHLSHLLRKHVERGDPVDVANFAMMIHQRGERIASSQEPVWTVETLAQWLHDEVEWPEYPYPNRTTWPEYEGDTGQRDDGHLKILSSDVQEQFRDIARRLLTRQVQGGHADDR